jgi:hypothetical protein
MSAKTEERIPTAELEPVKPRLRYTSPGVLRVTTIEDMLRLAEVIARSALVPESFRGKPADCVVAMQYGAEIGLSPMQALTSIAVINGRPTLWGDGLLGVVEGSGLMDSIKETDDGTTATCQVVRHGRPPTVRTFSMDDAKRANLLGKGPWTQYPGRMRQMRARSWALRDAFADVLKGIVAREEVEDYGAATDVQQFVDRTAEAPGPGAKFKEIVSKLPEPSPPAGRTIDRETGEVKEVENHAAEDDQAFEKAAPPDVSMEHSLLLSNINEIRTKFKIPEPVFGRMCRQVGLLGPGQLGTADVAALNELLELLGHRKG